MLRVGPLKKYGVLWQQACCLQKLYLVNLLICVDCTLALFRTFVEIYMKI